MSDPYPESNSSYWEDRCENAENKNEALLDALEAAEAALEDWACFECDDSMPMRDRSGDDGCPLCQRALAALAKIRALREGDEDAR